jgi:hypothetical protein
MLAFWGDVAQANEIQLAAIEQRAIAFRQSINSGDVQITSKVDFQDGNIRERTYVVFFDGLKKRMDIEERNYVEGERPGQGAKRSAAWGEDAFRYFTRELTPDGASLISLIAAKSSKRAKMEERSDPRMLGMYPVTFGNLITYKLNSRLTHRNGVLDVEVRNEKVDGRLYHQITYREKWGSDIVTLSPTQDYNVTRFERLGKDGTRLRLLEIELSEVEDFGWFPRELVSVSKISEAFWVVFAQS